MGYVKTQVLRYPVDGGAADIITSHVTDWKTSQSINKKAGTFSFGMNNPQGFNTGSLQYGDNIEIKVNRLGETDQTIMFGVVEEENSRALSGKLEYRGIDYAGKLMDAIVQQVYNSGTEMGVLWDPTYNNGVINGSYAETYGVGSCNSSAVLKHLIRQFYYKALPTDVLDTVTYVDMNTKGWASVGAFMETGSNFFKNFNTKRIAECIDEIKTNDFTGNGDYIFYVDNERKIHFKPKPNYTYDHDVTGDNDDVNDFDLQRSTFNQYTAILVNAGNVSGTTYDQYCAGYNRTAIRQSGWKWGYMDEKGIATQIDNTDAYKSLSVSDRVKMVKERGREKATIVARDEGLPKWGGKITIRGSNDFAIGSAYDVVIGLSRFGDGEGDKFGTKTLRLIGIDHQFSDKGWFTTLELKQDYGDIR